MERKRIPIAKGGFGVSKVVVTKDVYCVPDRRQIGLFEVTGGETRTTVSGQLRQLLHSYLAIESTKILQSLDRHMTTRMRRFP